MSGTQAAMTPLPLTNQDGDAASADFFYSFLCFLACFLRSVLLLTQTCSRSPGAPGCTGAAPCPGAPGGPAACAVRRVTHGPGLGWSDAGGTDLHP